VPALEAFETVVTGLDHPEGIAVGLDGSLVAGGEAGQLYRIGEGGVRGDRVHRRLHLRRGGRRLGRRLRATSATPPSCGSRRPARSRPTSNGTAERPMRVLNFAAFDDGGTCT
jgi:hypothetical protein